MDVQNIYENSYERCSRKIKKKSGKKPIIIFTSPKVRTRPVFFGIYLALAKFLVSMLPQYMALSVSFVSCVCRKRNLGHF